MPNQQETDHRVLDVIGRSPGPALDNLVLECPDLPWNQVFAVIDRLSREGVLTRNPKGRGQYAIIFATMVDAPHHAEVGRRLPVHTGR